VPVPAHEQTEMRSKLKGKMTENKEHQAVTRGIKHWGLSGYSSVLPRIKFGVTGQVSSPQSPTISYRHPLWATLKDNDSEQINEQTKTGKCQRTNGTFGFARQTSRPFAKPKEPFLANAPIDNYDIKSKT